jgi:hypothetical protein
MANTTRSAAQAAAVGGGDGDGCGPLPKARLTPHGRKPRQRRGWWTRLDVTANRATCLTCPGTRRSHVNEQHRSRQSKPTRDRGQLGRGPALHCLCVATWPDVMVKVRSTVMFDLSPNESTEQTGAASVRIQPRGWQVPAADIIGPPPAQPVPAGSPTNRVAFCQDQLGNSSAFCLIRWMPTYGVPETSDLLGSTGTSSRRHDLELL